MFKKILIGLAVAIAGLVIVVTLQPAAYHVERAAQIAAPAEVVWAEVANFKQWKNWSHWEKSDPDQKTTITGEPAAVGHKTVWNGEKTGQGSMTITAATAPSHLDIALEFIAPMQGQATTAMDITSSDSGVMIKWTLDGENGFVGKFFGLVMGVEEMVGKAYESGLADLKTIAETNAKKQAEEKAAQEAAARAEAEAAAAAAAAPAAEAAEGAAPAAKK